MNAPLPKISTVDQRALALLAPGADCDPLNPDNFAEAMLEVSSKTSSTLFESAASLVKSNNADGLLLALKEASTGYWIEYARAEARGQIDREAKAEYDRQFFSR